MNASVSNAKGKEKVGRLSTLGKEKKKSLKTSGFVSLCSLPIPVSSPEDPVWERRDDGSYNQAEVLLIAYETL